MARIYLRLQLEASTWPEWMDNPPVKTNDGLGKMATFTCGTCGKDHDKLWFVHRVMVDTFGHFPVFRLNGTKHVIDGSLPTVVDKIPRGAVSVRQSEAERLWHLDTGSHCFGS